MNPSALFSLTSAQKQAYALQPDSFSYPNTYKVMHEYEVTPYLSRNSFRFWYNTQAESYSEHWHDSREMIIPLENEYTVTISGKVWKLQPGDIFLIPSGEMHSLSAPENGSRFIFLYEWNMLNQLEAFDKIRPFFDRPIYLSMASCPKFYEKAISIIMKMAKEYWSDTASNYLHIYSLFFEFLASYADLCEQGYHPVDAITSSADSQSPSYERIPELLDYLNTDFSKKITLDMAAERISLSRSRFSKVFSEYTGKTFLDYLNQVRTDAAQKLLLTTRLSSSEVAHRCGFESISTFNRVFKQYKGCSPRDFRNTPPS